VETDDGRTGSAVTGRIVRERPVAGEPAAARVATLAVPAARSAAGHPGTRAPAPEHAALEQRHAEHPAGERPAGDRRVGEHPADEGREGKREQAASGPDGGVEFTDGPAPDGRAPDGRADLGDGMDGAGEEPGGGEPGDDEPGDEARSRDFVQSFARGLLVIMAFADGTEMTLSDVARATGLPRAAARRFLLTLEELGYMHSTGRLFSPSPRLLGLALPYLASGAGLEELLGAINGSIPFARASRSTVHHGLLPKLAAAARSGTSPDSAG
jgi:IclR helix-turn-helix domain